MSVAASTAIALGVAAGTAGAGIYGAHKMGESADQANATSSAASMAAIEEQKRQDAQQKAEFDAQQAQAKAQWDAEQQIRAPYRQAGLSALTKLGDLLGTQFDPSMMQAPAYVPPAPNQPAAPSMGGNPAAANARVKLNALLPQPANSPIRYPVQT